MSQNVHMPDDSVPEVSLTTNCANCHSPMPSGLRFCRNCGFRLGEGSAEYTETVRFQNGGPATALGGVAGAIPYSAPYGTGTAQVTATPAAGVQCRKKRMSGMAWIFIALALFFVSAGALTRFARHTPRIPGISGPSVASTRSYVGVNQFDTTDGGVTFADVEPPGSPADKAGLVGGDIITTFDGHRVESDDEMMDLLGKTPIGKTVEVIFIRDGETKITKLTTISKADFDQLVSAFRNRPEGRARLGIDDQDEVDVPGTKLRGVKFSVQPSLPADMAGLRSGDIIIGFGDVPIRTEEELSSRIQRALPYSTVDIEIIRGSERLKIPVKLGRQNR